MATGEMDNSAIAGILIAKGANGLYHANSVRAARTFLRNGGLHSREAVEKRGYEQTPQYSDEIDKAYSIYNDIFLDAVDIHHRVRSINKYGPVLFVFDLEGLLNDHSLPPIRIIRKNPTKWVAGEPDAQRYYVKEREFEHGYALGTFDTMITISTKSGQISLQPHIREVVLDDPGMEDSARRDVYADCLRLLQDAAKEGGLGRELIRKRVCREGCVCKSTYRREWTTRQSHF